MVNEYLGAAAGAALGFIHNNVPGAYYGWTAGRKAARAGYGSKFGDKIVKFGKKYLYRKKQWLRFLQLQVQEMTSTCLLTAEDLLVVDVLVLLDRRLNEEDLFRDLELHRVLDLYQGPDPSVVVEQKPRILTRVMLVRSGLLKK